MRRFVFGLAVAATAAMLPCAAMADDHEVAQEIATALRSSGKLKDYSVGVKYHEGTVWLRGNVRSREQMNTALESTLNMAGVNKVINQLQVARAARQTAATAAAPARLDAAGMGNMDANHIGSDGPIAMSGGVSGTPLPMYGMGATSAISPASYDQPNMPGYAWPSYAAYPNYAALSYPRQYSPTAWPFIGPFYPYPQVPLGWRSVTLEWDDGWWFLDFRNRGAHGRHWVRR